MTMLINDTNRKILGLRTKREEIIEALDLMLEKSQVSWLDSPSYIELRNKIVKIVEDLEKHLERKKNNLRCQRIAFEELQRKITGRLGDYHSDLLLYGQEDRDGD
jgi:hypothetical protein